MVAVGEVLLGGLWPGGLWEEAVVRGWVLWRIGLMAFGMRMLRQM